MTSISFPDEDGREWALRTEGPPGHSTLYEVLPTMEREVGRVRAIRTPHRAGAGKPMQFFALPKGRVLEASFDDPGDAVKYLVKETGGG